MKESDLKKLKIGQEINERGLRARKNKDGTCSFQIVKKLRGGRNPLRRVLGIYPDMAISEAESKAILYRNLMSDGIDPYDYEEKERNKAVAERKVEESKSKTLRLLLDDYEREGVDKGNASSTLRDQRSTILRVWEPFLDKPIQQIDRQDLLDHNYYWNSQRKGRHGRPAKEDMKKAIRILRAMFNYAINVRELLDRNPCDIFKGRKESTSSTRREGHLKTKECIELWEWLGRLNEQQKDNVLNLKHAKLKEYDLGEERQTQYHAIALELLTGLRKNEILQLPWKDVFLEKDEYEDEGAEGPYFRITTSKQKRPFGVPITDEMKTIFNLRKDARVNDYVFPSPKPLGKGQAPLGDDKTAFAVLNKLMPNLKEAPKLSANVLRHTFATACYHLTKSFELTDMITGHISGRINRNVATATYVHVQAETYREYFEELNAMLVGDKEKDVDWEAIPQDTEEMDRLIQEMSWKRDQARKDEAFSPS